MEIPVFIRVFIRFPLRMRAQACVPMRACVCVPTRPSRQSPAPSPLPPSHTPRGVAYGLQASPLLVPSSCRQALRSLSLATCPPASLTSIGMQAGFSLPRPPSCALIPFSGVAQTWGTCPLSARLLTRIGAQPTELRGTRSLRSLVCLRAPGIAPARPIVAGRAFAPPACLTSIAPQAGTPFRLRQASASDAFSGYALTLATAPLRAPLLTRGDAIDITSLAVLRSALGAPSLSGRGGGCRRPD